MIDWFQLYRDADTRRNELARGYGYVAATLKELARGHIAPQTALANVRDMDAQLWPDRPAASSASPLAEHNLSDPIEAGVGDREDAR